MVKLLMHIAYYMNSDKRLDNKNNINKSDKDFTEHVLEGVKNFLNEINNYFGFIVIDVIIDINIENNDVYKINLNKYNNLNITINKYNFKDEHPFRLTTKHRLSMIKNINNYDWFGYSEDDTIILKDTISFLLNNSEKLFKLYKKVYTIPRLVFDQNKKYYYSDIRQSSNNSININNFKSIIPTNNFGACWFYPKIIMNIWINHNSFLNFNYPNINGGIRVKMGSGIPLYDAIIPLNIDNEPKIFSIHLGYSGKYYFKHLMGYHTLPINKILEIKHNSRKTPLKSHKSKIYNRLILKFDKK